VQARFQLFTTRLGVSMKMPSQPNHIIGLLTDHPVKFSFPLAGHEVLKGTNYVSTYLALPLNPQLLAEGSAYLPEYKHDAQASG
jgi:hypothetical protein